MSRRYILGTNYVRVCDMHDLVINFRVPLISLNRIFTVYRVFEKNTPLCKSEKNQQKSRILEDRLESKLAHNKKF